MSARSIISPDQALASVVEALFLGNLAPWEETHD